MTDFDYGPLQTYEITWQSGHTERIQGHQVTFPQRGEALVKSTLLMMTEMPGRSRVDFHGQIDGRWRLVLSATEEDIRTIRLVTADEPVPQS